LPADTPRIHRIGGKSSESSRLGLVPVRRASRFGRCAGRIAAASLVPMGQPAVAAMRLAVRRVLRRRSSSFFLQASRHKAVTRLMVPYGIPELQFRSK